MDLMWYVHVHVAAKCHENKKISCKINDSSLKLAPGGFQKATTMTYIMLRPKRTDPKFTINCNTCITLLF